MWKLLSINPNPFNLQTRFRVLFTAITLSFNIFYGLHIYDEIKTSFTLLSLHCRPMLTVHSTISFFVSCLLPISLQPMCNIKTFGVSSFKIGFTYLCLHLFQSGAWSGPIVSKTLTLFALLVFSIFRLFLF